MNFYDISIVVTFLALKIVLTDVSYYASWLSGITCY